MKRLVLQLKIYLFWWLLFAFLNWDFFYLLKHILDIPNKDIGGRFFVLVFSLSNWLATYVIQELQDLPSRNIKSDHKDRLL